MRSAASPMHGTRESWWSPLRNCSDAAPGTGTASPTYGDFQPPAAGSLMRHMLRVAVLLLAIADRARAQGDTSAPSDTMPATVVQRFVDAANARDASAMAELV